MAPPPTIRRDRHHLPDQQCRPARLHVPDHGGDTRRVFDPSGAYIGTVTYASRRIGTCTEYGWRTASGRKLTT